MSQAVINPRRHGRAQSAFPVFSNFLRWWLGELKDLVPTSMKRALLHRQALVLETIDERLVATHVAGTKTKAVGHVTLRGAPPEQQASEIRHILASVRLSKTEVVLRLPRNQCLCWQLDFPSDAEGDLGQALAFQIDHKTPFKAEETYFDYAVVARSADGAQIVVSLVVAPRRAVDAMLAKVAAWKLRLDRIDVEQGAGEALPRLNLLPRDQDGGDRKRLGRFNAMLALVVVGLLIGSIALPLGQRRAQLESLQDQLGEARRAAAETLAVRAEVEQLAGEYQFVATQKTSRPVQVLVIDELSAVLPDNSSLTELRINGSDVRIVGTSAAASALVSLINGSAMFARPRFRSPITQDPRDGLERFNLSFEIRKGEGNEQDF